MKISKRQNFKLTSSWKTTHNFNGEKNLRCSKSISFGELNEERHTFQEQNIECFIHANYDCETLTIISPPLPWEFQMLLKSHTEKQAYSFAPKRNKCSEDL